MKVIFLDIDGVMKPGRCYFQKDQLPWYLRIKVWYLDWKKRRNPNAPTKPWKPPHPLWEKIKDRLKLDWVFRFHRRGGFDPLAIKAINRLHKKTGAVVVLNTTWNVDGIWYLRFIFRREGLTAPIVGLTAYPRDVKQSYQRLEAIESWLTRKNGAVTHWCALDDAIIHSPHAIQVDPENGILIADYRKAAELLGHSDPMVVYL